MKENVTEMKHGSSRHDMLNHILNQPKRKLVAVKRGRNSAAASFGTALGVMIDPFLRAASFFFPSVGPWLI